jgi:hypothetical protein
MPRYLTVLSTLWPASRKIDSTVRYLSIEVDDAFAIAE